MAFLIACSAAVGGGSTATAGSVDTTGATLIVCAVGGIAGAAAITCTDTNGSGSINTYTALSQPSAVAGRTMNLFYKISPTTSTTHSFVAAAVSTGYPGIAVAAFSNTPVASHVSDTSFVSSAGSTVQPGSITPSETTNLLVSGYYGDADTSIACNTLAIPANGKVVGIGGTALGVAIAYIIQAAATAQNPTWTCGSNGSTVWTVMSEFKENGGGGGFTALNRKTLSGLGSHVGGRTIHDSRAFAKRDRIYVPARMGA